jgi:hypothetical protein
MSENEYKGTYIRLPLKVGKDSPSLRPYEWDGKDLVGVTLPYGTKVGDTDLSFGEFTVLASQVDVGFKKEVAAGEVPKPLKSHSVWVPNENKEGEAWTVNVRKSVPEVNALGEATGAYKKIELGRFTGAELREALDAQYEARKAKQAEARAQEKDKAAPKLDDEAKDALAAKDAQAASAPAPAQER